MTNSFFRTFRVQSFFNPSNGPSDNLEVKQAEKPVDFQQEMADMTNPDGSINHGKNKPGELGEKLDAEKARTEKAQELAQDMLNNPDVSPETKQALEQAQEQRDAGRKEVIEDTAEQLSQKEKYEKEKVKLEWDGDKLNRDSFVQVLSDLSGNGSVEVKNLGFWRRLFSNNTQRYIVGEQQLRNAIDSLNLNGEQLDQLYQNWTGSAESIQITKEDITKNGKIDKTKAKKFQQALLERVGMIQSVGRIMIDEGYNSGLMSALSGRAPEDIQQAFQDPEKVKKFQEIIANSPEMKNNANFAQKVVAALAKIGISVAAGVFTGGILQVRTQTEEIKTEKVKDTGEPLTSESGENGADASQNVENTQTDAPKTAKPEKDSHGVRLDAQNLSARKIIGHDGKSVVLDFDILGVNGEINWSDQAARMYVAQEHFNAKPDKRQAYKDVIKLTEARLPSKDTPENAAKRDAIAKLSQIYTREQELALGLAKDPQNRERALKQMMENTKMYAARVEEINGIDLKGAYANISLSGLAVGVQWNKTSIESTEK